MKQGGRQRQSTGLRGFVPANGFTVVETLIVLAVTSLLFLSAVVLISGRQNKTQFTTAINGLRQQLQQIINETASGYYPNNSDFTCNGTVHPVRFMVVSSGQGSNSGCIFLGKALQFGTAADASQLAVLPIAGNQYLPSTTDAVLTITDAAPRAIYPANTSATESSVPKTAVVTDTMQSGLTVAAASSACPSGGMCYTTGGSPVATGVIAFLAGDATGTIAAQGTDGLNSGAQQLSLYGVRGATVNEALDTATRAIGNAGGQPTHLEAAQSVSICVASSGTDQSGLITIDGNLHVSLVIREGHSC